MYNDTLLAFSEDSFGPRISPTIRALDFTLLFEELILSIGPTCLLLLLAPLRLIFLARKQHHQRVQKNRFQIFKLCALSVYGASQVALLALFATSDHEMTRATLASQILNIIGSFFLCALSYYEHLFSLRPSLFLNIYLFLSLIFDCARARTIWFILPADRTVASVFLASIILKVIVLILEEQSKSNAFTDKERAFSPETVVGLTSQSFFWWLNELLTEGYRKIITPGDLYPLNDDFSSEALGKKLSDLWQTKSKSDKDSVLIASLGAFGWPFIAPIFPRIVMIALTFCQPILINRFLAWLQQPESSQTRTEGYGLVGAYGCVYIGLAIFTGYYFHRLYRYIAMVRAALIIIIYNKSTELCINSPEGDTALTLMTTDVERIIEATNLLHEVWAHVIEAGIGTWLLYNQLGYSAFAAPVVALLCGGLATRFASTASSRQDIWMKSIQKRLGVFAHQPIALTTLDANTMLAATSIMLGDIKGFKMFGLGGKASAAIQALRVEELLSAVAFRRIIRYTTIIAFSPEKLCPVLTFALYVVLSRHSGETLDVERLFTSYSILLLLTEPLSELFQAIPMLASARGCFHRIQNFLVVAPREEFQLDMNTRASPSSWTFPASAQDNLTSQRLTEFGEETLEEAALMFSIRNGSFAWAHNTELILRNVNLDIAKGKITVLTGSVGSGKSTLLKVLLGELVCREGAIYSSMSTAAFCDQTPWLVGGTIQDNITGFSNYDAEYYRKTIYSCALEEDISSFPEGDQTMIKSQGIALSGGQKQRLALARAVYSRKEVLIIDDVFSGLDTKTSAQIFQRLFGEHGMLSQTGISTIIATHSVEFMSMADHVIMLDDSGGITRKERSTESNMQARSTSEQINATPQALDLVNAESPKPDPLCNVRGNIATVSPANQPTSVSRQRGDLRVYKYWFRSVGWKYIAAFFAAQVVIEASQVGSDVWLIQWSSANNNNNQSDKNDYYLGIYALFKGLGLGFMFILGWITFSPMITHAGLRLHSVVLGAVLSAPMAFFGKTDVGTIINRFSQDMQLVDAVLPLCLLNFVNNSIGVLGQIGLIVSATGWMGLAIPPLALAYWMIQSVYLRTSRQLRLLEIEAKGPLCNHFIQTFGGLATIRVFGWQQNELEVCHELTDASQKPFYMFNMLQRWLTLVLDLATAGLTIILVGLATKLRGSVNPSLVGVAFVNLTGLSTSIKSCVLVWTKLEASLGAVARVRDFEQDCPVEDRHEENQQPPESWPMDGEIKFNDVSAAYISDDLRTLAISSIDLSIRPGQKVCICGRTGSGKSSLTLSILRMVELIRGTITIDGIDISNLPRSVVRSSINVIPQDPFFMRGTVREELDLFSQNSSTPDSKSWEILTQLQLAEIIRSMGGLDVPLDLDQLSHGQRQLFCLARAILRRSKILILDEATSNVDVKTNALMQGAIQEHFVDTTIVAVTHRLDTILDFDTVIVMDAGIIVESGPFQSLLSIQNGWFRNLYDQFKSEDEANSKTQVKIGTIKTTEM